MADTTLIYGVRRRVEKNGPAIRDALDPADRDEFVAELRTALAEADETLDVGLVADVVDRWWGRAVLTANPEVEAGAAADLRRVRAGDPTVFGASAYGDQEDDGGRQVQDPLGHLRRATA